MVVVVLRGPGQALGEVAAWLLWLSDPAGSSGGMESVAMIRQAQGDFLRADVDALDSVEDVDL
jgi:hypothetical protein